jgi:hypothetical protein
MDAKQKMIQDTDYKWDINARGVFKVRMKEGGNNMQCLSFSTEPKRPSVLGNDQNPARAFGYGELLKPS